MHQSKEAKFQGKSMKVVMKCLQELVSQSSTELVGGQCLLIYSGHWTLDTGHCSYMDERSNYSAFS